MSQWRPSIAVIGAGGVGAYYGGRLAQHGHDVHFLLRSEYEAVARQGWTIRSCDGDFVIPPQQARVYRDAAEMPKADLVIVALKATANDQYEALIRPVVKEGSWILTLQNGLGNEDRLARLFGAERIFGGLAFVCINRVGPGVVHHMDHGLVRVGEFLEGSTERARKIVELFSGSRIRCDLLESLKYGRWEKLVWNIPFNGLGAGLDMTTDQLIGSSGGRELVGQVMQEVIAAARAHGVELPADIVEVKIRQTSSMGPYRSSMQVDRNEGRPLEVEAILGAPVRAAEANGVAVPRLRMLYQILQLVDLQIRRGRQSQ